MKVILKQDIENLGIRGDIVDVAPGFGRNYLIPKRLALKVTSSNMKMIEIERQALKKKLDKERLSYQELIEKLNETTISFKRKSGEKDIIFGSVSSSDIKDSLHELGFEIDKKKILLEEPIKRLGNYTVPIKIFHEDRAEIKIEVMKEEEGVQEEKKEKEKVEEERMEELADEKMKLETEEEKETEVEAKEEEKRPDEKMKESGEKQKEKESIQEKRKAKKEEPVDVKVEEAQDEEIKPERKEQVKEKEEKKKESKK